MAARADLYEIRTMKFKTIALRNAARGFRVLPLNGKRAIINDWPNVASVDQRTIETWAARFPDANCGIAGGDDIIGLDTDRADRLHELCSDLAPGTFETFSVTSGRPNRAHYYFRATPQALSLGNIKWREPNAPGNVFEVKGAGAYLVAEGSIHPDTGEIYRVVQDLPLIDFPSALVTKLLDLHRRDNPRGKREWSLPVRDGDGRDDYFISEAGKLRNLGCSEEIILARLQEINSDPQMVADAKSDDDLRRIARSAARYDVPPPEPKVVIGAQVRQPLLVAEKTARPVYPDAVWDGTIFGDFADIVCRGNFIPRKFVAESFRILTGAIAGDQVTCGLAGVRLREYLTCIGEPQAGKSWALDCSQWFYTKQAGTTLFEPLLIEHGGETKWRSRCVGAQRFLPGSPNAFVDELTRDDRRKERKPAIKVEITERWIPTARLITIQGEAMSLFARLASSDWTGQALSALVTDLYDGVDAEVAITGQREMPRKPVRLQYSMLLYTQPRIWRKFMADHLMDSGLFGRFYLVGSGQKPKRVTLPD